MSQMVLVLWLIFVVATLSIAYYRTRKRVQQAKRYRARVQRANLAFRDMGAPTKPPPSGR